MCHITSLRLYHRGTAPNLNIALFRISCFISTHWQKFTAFHRNRLSMLLCRCLHFLNITLMRISLNFKLELWWVDRRLSWILYYRHILFYLWKSWSWRWIQLRWCDNLMLIFIIFLLYNYFWEFGRSSVAVKWLFNKLTIATSEHVCDFQLSFISSLRLSLLKKWLFFKLLSNSRCYNIFIFYWSTRRKLSKIF